jgi:hypothetical protein
VPNVSSAPFRDRPDLWDSVDVSSWPLLEVEKKGQDERRWVRDPATDHAWLFKPVVITNTGHRQGEDWAEALASCVGQLLEVPCAEIRLATANGTEGCLSKDLKPRAGWQIQPGSVLLTDVEPAYQSRAKGRPGHSLENIQHVLSPIAAPLGFSLGDYSAFDVFVGYLVLDAVIANRDRHDDNWSVLRPPDHGPDRLCGAYDNAGALGFNLTDAYRAQLISSGHLSNWVRNGTAHRFEHPPSGKPPTLVAFARQALTMVASNVASHWLEVVAQLDVDEVERHARLSPVMSEVTATFAISVLRVNQERMLSDGV